MSAEAVVGCAPRPRSRPSRRSPRRHRAPGSGRRAARSTARSPRGRARATRMPEPPADRPLAAVPFIRIARSRRAPSRPWRRGAPTSNCCSHTCIGPWHEAYLSCSFRERWTSIDDTPMAALDSDGLDDLIAEQIAYYGARAPEYFKGRNRDGSRGRNRGPAGAVRCARRARTAGDVLELACGPATWTAELLAYADGVTAIDASPEMLAIARATVFDPRVRFIHADVFEWTPERTYDTVFFGFWLSHVPLARFERFWSLVDGALRPGGRVMFVDDAYRTPEELIEGEESSTVERRLEDGTPYRAVKVPHTPSDLEHRLEQLGWRIEVSSTSAGPFYYGVGGRSPPDRASASSLRSFAASVVDQIGVLLFADSRRRGPSSALPNSSSRKSAEDLGEAVVGVDVARPPRRWPGAARRAGRVLAAAAAASWAAPRTRASRAAAASLRRSRSISASRLATSSSGGGGGLGAVTTRWRGRFFAAVARALPPPRERCSRTTAYASCTSSNRRADSAEAAL